MTAAGRRLPAGVIAGVCVFGALAGAVPSQVDAKTYEVVACRAAKKYRNDSRAFGFRRSSKRMVTRRDCSESGRGEGGLITRNRVHRGRVAYGAYAFASFRAPRGTAFVSMRWSGAYQRLDCNWSAQLYAQGRGRARLLRGVAGTTRRRCRKRAIPRVSLARIPRPRTVALGGATRIVQRVICVRRGGCSTARTSKGARAAFTTYYAQVKVADVEPPRVRILGGSLVSGRWVRGEQAVRFAASDNTGVAGTGALLASQQYPGKGNTCPESFPVCSNALVQIKAQTTGSTDGRQLVSVIGKDRAGNVGIARAAAAVDNHAPGRIPVGVVGSETWRRTNSFVLGWTNAPEMYAPIAGARYEGCTRQGKCFSGRVGGQALTKVGPLAVPGPGEWSLRLWREDAAGNADRELASDPVALRYDPEAPHVAFEPQQVQDPTRVSAAIRDGVSGVASGSIEVHRRGTNSWTSLPTSRQGPRLVARVDDAHLPAGLYDARARAVDRAGNETTSGHRQDGSAMTLQLPLRIQSRLRVRIAHRKVTRVTVRRNGKRRRVRRVRTVLRRVARFSVGHRGTVRGTLESKDGQPLSRARVLVLAADGGGSRLVGALTTNRDGRFVYRFRALRSRRLAFLYLGNTLTGPAAGGARTLVPASSTIRPNRRKARNGGSVLFRGRLRTRPVPLGGKLVELQAYFRGRWRTFQTVRTNPAGRWRFRYRFGATTGTVRYRFRARLPKESGYPFEGGRSPTVVVRVRGG